MKEFISYEDLARYEAEFGGSRANRIAMNAVTSVGFTKAAKRLQAPSANVTQFSVQLKEYGVTNQRSSGRCWMFAALNVLRTRVIEKLNLEKFELSQNYTHFYDKLEKANLFLVNILETAGEDIGSRYVQHLLRTPVSDGGQWDMITSIIDKYGVVPKEAMPETACSNATGEMNGILNELLRRDACRLRDAVSAGADEAALAAMKKEMLRDVYRLLCVCLGTPPETFDLEIRDKDKNFIADRGLTPLTFREKYADIDFRDYISLINAPTADKPYLRSYTVKFLGNVVGGTPVRYVNVPVDILRSAAIAQLQAGEPVWFGCDVGKQSDREAGTMDLNNFDYETLTGTVNSLTKADRLDYGLSQMTHAMVFRGVDLNGEGQPVRWRVENSWGPDRGDKGFYLMTDPWFGEYMYQVVVRKQYVPAEVLAAYEQEPVVLQPWDPMGSLA